jgi:hypothetical protein
VGKLTPEETVREHNQLKKPHVKVAHVIGVSLGHRADVPRGFSDNKKVKA